MVTPKYDEGILIPVLSFIGDWLLTVGGHSVVALRGITNKVSTQELKSMSTMKIYTCLFFMMKYLSSRPYSIYMVAWYYVTLYVYKSSVSKCQKCLIPKFLSPRTKTTNLASRRKNEENMMNTQRNNNVVYCAEFFLKQRNVEDKIAVTWWKRETQGDEFGKSLRRRKWDFSLGRREFDDPTFRRWR